jgi:hypothetical protein
MVVKKKVKKEVKKELDEVVGRERRKDIEERERLK